jgi:hypothetical protein
MSREERLHLVEEAGFIFRGKVLRRSAEVHVKGPAAGRAVPVEVEEILLSTDVLRGLAGRDVTVVSEHEPAMEQGAAFVFFTTCASLGEHAVLRELGHIESSRENVREVAELVRFVAERPLQARVAGADLIVTGRVIRSKPAAETRSVPKSEHDPDWWIAGVEVQSVIKGGKTEREIEVLFANSTDIAWYKAPKLHEGAHGILILRRVKKAEAPREVARSIYQCIDPLDFLPVERLDEVRRAIEHDKGDR